MGSAHEEDRSEDTRPLAMSEVSLAPVVNRLRDEVEGLRQAMRTRSMIEQAKGMLMERYGLTPEEAFDRLARLSQHANIKLTDVASALVESSISTTDSLAARVPRQRGEDRRGGDRRSSGESVAPTPVDVVRATHRQAVARWPQQGSSDNEFGARIRAQARRARTRSELLAARTPQDVVTTVAVSGLADFPPEVVVLATVDVNGVVTVVGSRGIPAQVEARWRVFPIDLDLPVCRTLRTGKTTWLVNRPDVGDRERPPMSALGLGLPEVWDTAALLPLPIGIPTAGCSV